MAVIFMLLTFLGFVLLDWLVGPVAAPIAGLVPTAAPAPGQRYVDGFLAPERLRYHAGHSWLSRERKNLFRVGVDDFAARLAGKIEKIELPKPGTWIRQGQKAWSVTRGGETVSMVSPTEGEVVEINEKLLSDPSLLRKSPYDFGWIMTLSVPDEEGTTRNLVPQNLVANWMREAVNRLYAHQPELAGAVAADAGQPVEDIAEALPHVRWTELAGEFFLTR